VGVRISKTATQPYCLRFEATENADEELSEDHKALSFVSGLVINQCLSNKVPHNLIATNEGRTIYFFPRSKANSGFGWLEISGIARQELQQPAKQLWQETSVGAEQFKAFVDEFEQLLHSHFN
jgi:hypothetical protein